MPSVPQLVLFDFDLGGHHGSYIQHLITYWQKHNFPGCLQIVVRPEFFQIHTDPVRLAACDQRSNVKFTAITQTEANRIDQGQSRWERFVGNFRRWQLFRKYATELAATHALFLYFDRCQLPLALGARSPCPFSGIYFRPTFHYEAFPAFDPSWYHPMQLIKERMILNQVLKHPQLKTLFCLDPFAIQNLQQMSRSVKVTHLPDPVSLPNQADLNSEQLRKRLAIQPHRQIFLLFGALDERKGIDQVLRAIAQLPNELCDKLCLLLAGGTHPKEQDRIRTQINETCAKKPVQIVTEYQFIPEAEVLSYFHLAEGV